MSTTKILFKLLNNKELFKQAQLAMLMNQQGGKQKKKSESSKMHSGFVELVLIANNEMSVL